MPKGRLKWTLTFVFKIFWETVKEREHGCLKKNTFCRRILADMLKTKQTHPSLTSLIRLMKASLLSLAFLLRFSPFNPSRRNCSRSKRQIKDKSTHTNWSHLLILAFYSAASVPNTLLGGSSYHSENNNARTNTALTSNRSLFQEWAAWMKRRHDKKQGWNLHISHPCWVCASSFTKTVSKTRYLVPKDVWERGKQSVRTNKQTNKRWLAVLPEMSAVKSSGISRILPQAALDGPVGEAPADTEAAAGFEMRKLIGWLLNGDHTQLLPAACCPCPRWLSPPAMRRSWRFDGASLRTLIKSNDRVFWLIPDHVSLKLWSVLAVCHTGHGRNVFSFPFAMIPALWICQHCKSKQASLTVEKVIKLFLCQIYSSVGNRCFKESFVALVCSYTLNATSFV